jgi:multicomponent Na+:H+ antiporter subunit D
VASVFPILPVLVPLVAATLLLFLRGAQAQRLVCLLSVLVLFGIELAALPGIAAGDILTHRLGDWPAPFGIILVVDRLSIVMLLLASLTGLAILLYEWGERDNTLADLRFFPLFLFLMMGLNGAFVTGDIFNLFVFFEVLLISSYGLLTLGAKARQLGAGFQFVVLNLLNSALFLFGVGLLYGLTGTLNFADLAVKVAAVPLADAMLLHAAVMVLLVVFAGKAALLPLSFWMPDAYPTAPPAVAAMFGGIATKVGVYALARVFTTAFTEVRDLPADVLVAFGVLSMLVGVLGAVAQTEFRRLLSFHIVSQIGYLVFGVAMFTVAGLAAAVFYLVHYTIVKCALFLVAGIGEKLGGSSDLKKLGGLAHLSPALAVLFFVAGISLAGLPPTSGFFGKFILLSAGIEAQQYVGVAVGFVAGLLTLFSMMKIWTMAFWGEPAQVCPEPPRRLQLIAVALLVSFSVTLAAGAAPMYRFAHATAEQLLDTPGYVRAVLGDAG